MITNDYEYNYDEKIGGIVITKYIGNKTDVTIPAEIDGKKVVKIDKYAFAMCANITNLIISTGVSEIGVGSFAGCSTLKTIIIPDSVVTIGDWAFNDCTSLVTVSIPKSVSKLGIDIFNGCTAEIIYKGINYAPADYDKFYIIFNPKPASSSSSSSSSEKPASSSSSSSSKPTSSSSSSSSKPTTPTTAPESPASDFEYEYNERLGGMAITWYYGNDSVVNIPAKIDGIKVVAIGIENEYAQAFEAGVFVKKDGIKSIIIPNGVKFIGRWAIYDCKGLTSITIPNSVTEIGGSAFGGCTDLKSVTIPNSVTKIERGAFAGCIAKVTYKGKTYSSSQYEDLYDAINSKTTPVTTPESPASDFEYKYNSELGGIEITKYIGNKSVVNIPEKINGKKVVKIGAEAFYSRKGLKSIIIPSSVTSIGLRAFCYCTGLTSITIPNSVKVIDNRAFSYCSGLTSLTIPSSVSKMGFAAFSSCTGLTSITIQNGVKVIGECAFSGCTGLTSIALPNSIIDIGWAAFEECTARITYKGTVYTSKNYNSLYYI